MENRSVSKIRYADVGERIDDIGFGNLKLIQKPEAFCYGVDAVLVSGFLAKIAKNPEIVCDLGTGTGIIPLILSHKTDARKIVAVELQKESADRAERNVRLNRLEERIEIIHSDIMNLDNSFTGKFSCVVSNPPYMSAGGAITGKESEKMIARHETSATLADFMAVASRLLQRRGELFMVHRPARLADLIYYGRTNNLELKTMQMVLPKENASPNIVLLHYVKGGGKELNVMPSLCVHSNSGGYTDELLEMYEK